MRYRNFFAIACATALLCAGCSSSSDSAGSSSAAGTSGAKPAASAAPAKAEGDDFCSRYATLVAQGLVNMKSAVPAGPAAQEALADELAKKAPVSQAELQEVAPAEPLAWLKAVEKANAAAAAGDFKASDEAFANLVKINDWSIANCDSKYRSIFTEYKGVIG